MLQLLINFSFRLEISLRIFTCDSDGLRINDGERARQALIDRAFARVVHFIYSKRSLPSIRFNSNVRSVNLFLFDLILYVLVISLLIRCYVGVAAQRSKSVRAKKLKSLCELVNYLTWKASEPNRCHLNVRVCVWEFLGLSRERMRWRTKEMNNCNAM